ncbi:hypothetical protein ACLOJK_002501 [Asimina triloba]
MAIAIRVLAGAHFRLALLEFGCIQSNSVRKFQSFSKSSPLPSTIPSEFQQNSQTKHLIPLSNLLRRYGLPSSHLLEFIQKNRFLLKSDLSDIERCLGILLSFELSQKSLVSVLISCPGVLELAFLRKWQMGFSELVSQNVPSAVIQSVLEHSGSSSIDPDEFFQNLRILKDAGLSDESLTRALQERPRSVMIRTCRLNSLIEFFKRIGVRGFEFDRLCNSFPEILALAVEDRLRLLLEEFDELGFPWVEVRKAVVRDPRMLSVEAGELSYCTEFLKKLKCRLPIKERILQYGIVQAVIRVKLRVDCLCRHGLIRRDAFNLLLREPRTIIYPLEDVEKKIEFLLHRMGFGIDSLMEAPEYLGVNFEKQIVARYSVIEHLRSIGGLGLDVSLKALIRPSRLKFYNFFVKPYPECEEIFGRFSKAVEVGRRHPVGLWKLFKPEKIPDSEEDLSNIKSFMETLV